MRRRGHILPTREDVGTPEVFSISSAVAGVGAVVSDGRSVVLNPGISNTATLTADSLSTPLITDTADTRSFRADAPICVTVTTSKEIRVDVFVRGIETDDRGDRGRKCLMRRWRW